MLLLRADGHSYKAICELIRADVHLGQPPLSEGRQALRLLVDDESGSESPCRGQHVRIGPSAPGQFERAGLLQE